MRSAELFPTSRPLSSDQMIGRQHQIGQLAANLADGKHQIVAGPRRQGKTTVCQAALEQLRQDGLYVVQLDLFMLHDLAGLARGLVAGLIANRSFTHRAAARTRQITNEISRDLIRTLTVKWGPDIEIALNPDVAEKDPIEAFYRAILLLQTAAERDDKQLVLYIDEFQEFISTKQIFGDPDEITKKLRTALQLSPRVTCLFSGSVYHLMSELLAEESRALYGWGQWYFEVAGEASTGYPLEPITTPEWIDGLQTKFQQGSRPISESALLQLLERSERHVRTVMLLAQESYQAAKQDEQVDVTSPEHVQMAWYSAMDSEQPSHISDLGRIRQTGKYAQAVCQAIVHHKPLYRIGNARAINHTLELLLQTGLVEHTHNTQPAKTGTAGKWTVPDPLFRTFLSGLDY